MLVDAINRHWAFINDQITKVFNGEKTVSIDNGKSSIDVQSRQRERISFSGDMIVLP